MNKKRFAIVAEIGDFNLATVAPILATSLGYASGALPDRLFVTIEVRGKAQQAERPTGGE